MDTPNEYSVCIRLIQEHHPNILDGLSAWPMDTPNEYSVCIQLIREHRPNNIGWTVSLTNGYTQWIFCVYPANLRAPPDNIGWTVSQYQIACQTDVLPLNHHYFSFSANLLFRLIEYLLGSYGVIWDLYEAVGPLDSIGYWISDVRKVDSFLIPTGHVVTSIKYRSADLYNSYTVYSPVDVRWHV